MADRVPATRDRGAVRRSSPTTICTRGAARRRDPRHVCTGGGARVLRGRRAMDGGSPEAACSRSGLRQYHPGFRLSEPGHFYLSTPRLVHYFNDEYTNNKAG